MNKNLKYDSKNAYWVEPETGKPRYEFNDMYRDLSDPWGCEQKNKSLTNRLFLELLFDPESSYRNILDIGSGKGALTNLVFEKYNMLLAQNKNASTYQITGLEYSSIAVDEAKNKYPSISFLEYNILNEEPVPKTDIDLVILSEVLWYLVSDLKRVFEKIYNCMSEEKSKQQILGIHQYFPSEQKFFKEYIDGENGFDVFLEQFGKFQTIEKVKVIYRNQDSVLLYKLKKI
jgi:SAM-dependent methyltransferase